MKLLALVTLFIGTSAFANVAQNVAMEEGWRIQDSQVVGVGGDQVSQAGFNDSSWYAARVPSTILGNIVDDQASSADHKDPFYGTNLMTLMGTPPFSPLDGGGTFEDFTPDSSPFSRPWWYRREFTVPAASAGSQVTLILDGITYGAEVWVNGNRLAEHEETPGSYRAFRWEIGQFLNPPSLGSPNVIAVEVWTPEPHDLTPSWVDWNFTPQDKNMGLWRGASLSFHGAVTVDHPQVLSSVTLPAGDQAALTVEADFTNTSAQAISGTASGTIEGITFSQQVDLDAGETKTISFSPEDFPQLKVQNPRLWWPAQMGKPNLYHLNISFSDGTVSDQKEIDFGIRQIDSDINSQNSRQFYVNGKPLLIRGGGWASDLFLRFNLDRIEKEMNYVLDLGLNTIRLEGDIQPDAFYTMADRKGILVMPGLVCCNAWQMDEPDWKKDQAAVADASVRDLILALRAHPSVFVFLYGSDGAPSEAREQLYLDAFHDLHWPNPVVASAAEDNTQLNGSTGFKMRGPYDYTAPSYWYTDKGEGGAFGFNTETSPGPSIPPMQSLKKFLPPENLDHIDAVWGFHAGQNGFNNINTHTTALEKMFGPIQNMNDMVEKSQLMDYADHRAMYEAFNRNKTQGATGIVQWMLNNAWPSVIWHLYDYYLQPGAAYFGVKEANRPLHLVYGYDNQEISLVNSTYEAHLGLHARAQVYDLDSNLLSTQDAAADTQPNDSQSVLKITAPTSVRGNIYFVKLQLRDAQGTLLDDNLYWLSSTPPDHNLKQGEPEADYTALSTMAKATVQVNASWDAPSKTETVVVTNPGKSIALLTNFRLTQGAQQDDILPVIWDDNDITLMPGEIRTIQARFPGASVEGTPEIHGNGWNVQAW